MSQPREQGAEEFRLQLSVAAGVATLSWHGRTSVDALADALGQAADDALHRQGLRRVEVTVVSTDAVARAAVHRARFRREGRRRQALVLEDGRWADVFLYARLADDRVDGPYGFSGAMNTVLPRTRTIGHVVFRNTSGHVLLLEVTYKSDWELPGGVVEPRESPRYGAEREVAEELGIRTSLGAPALVDWMPPSLCWDDAVEFLFDGGALTPAEQAAIVLNAGEIHAAHWVAEADLDAHVTPLSARRIRLLLHRSGPVFTEDGYPLS